MGVKFTVIEQCIAEVEEYSLDFLCSQLYLAAKTKLAKMGVEPIRPFGHRILNPERLPFRHSAQGEYMVVGEQSKVNIRHIFTI